MNSINNKDRLLHIVPSTTCISEQKKSFGSLVVSFFFGTNRDIEEQESRNGKEGRE